MFNYALIQVKTHTGDTHTHTHTHTMRTVNLQWWFDLCAIIHASEGVALESGLD